MASNGSDELVADGIRDDPDVGLRFGVGNFVIYKDKDRNGWIEGKVVKVAQRVELPHGSIFIHYIVSPHTKDADGTVWVKGDTDNVIRPRPDDLTPDPEKFKPFLTPPEPQDPLSDLYTGGNMVEQLRRLGGLVPIEPDESILPNIRERMISATTFETPNQISGVPGPAVVQFANLFQRRRHFDSRPNEGMMLDFAGTFKSAVPSEHSLRQLEEAARTSNEKMLQLGDALMIGFHGWPRNPTRASDCYRAAGMDCAEEELLDEKVGIAIGNPEAMVASAIVYFTYIQCNLMGLKLSDDVSYSRLLLYTIQVPGGIDLLHRMIWWTTNSVKRGWISPFAVTLAEAIEEVGLIHNRHIDDEIKELMDPLIQLWKYYELEMKFEQLQEQGFEPRGDPSNATIELFRLKADEIFKDLSVTSDTVHIEYHQLQRPPFPIVVIALLPSKQSVFKVVRLPDAMALSPFTQQSFEFAWLRISFELHLGDRQNRRRTRPSVFTVLDSHGNREFASYLKDAIRGSGSQVRLVSHDDPIRVSSRWWGSSRSISLGEIMRKVERRTILKIPGFLYDTDTTFDVVSGAQREFIQSYARDLFSSIGDDVEQSLRKAKQLRTHGNSLFDSADYTAAVKCYSVAIKLLSHVVVPDHNSYKLIGTILSERVACYLKLEEKATNPECRRLLAENAKKDCTLALESSLASDVSLLNDLRFRRDERDKAASRYDVLMTDFESVAPIIFPDNRANEKVQHGVFTAFSNHIYSGTTESFALLKRGLMYFLDGFLGPVVRMFSDAMAHLATESFALLKRALIYFLCGFLGPVVGTFSDAMTHLATKSFALLKGALISFLDGSLGPAVGKFYDAMTHRATESFALLKRGLIYFLNGFLGPAAKWMVVFSLLLGATGYFTAGIMRKEMTIFSIATIWLAIEYGFVAGVERREQRRRERNDFDSIHSVEDSSARSVVRQATNNERMHRDSDLQMNHAQPQDDLSQDIIHDATMEYGKIVHEHSLAKNAKDGCPVCIRDFSGELSHTHSVILPCGEHALCIECVCRLKKEADKAQTAPTCPLCRSSFDPDFVEDLALQVIDVDQELAMLIVKLPIGPDDRVNVARRLLWTSGFCLEKVIEALECMLDAQTSGALFRTTVDLTHQQKQTIYEKARWPVNKLQEQLKLLSEERRSTFETNSLERIDNYIRKRRTELALARQKAREEIYTQLNSVGNMGAQQGDGGIIQIDFHGLHVNEMYEKFKEQVKPILPVIRKVTVITGRGLHSADGESKLKKALMKHICKDEPDIRWQRVYDNPGALNVVWTPAA